MTGDRTKSYRDLLEEAQELGRLDGRFAAAFEPRNPHVKLWAGTPGRVSLYPSAPRG